MHAPNGFAYSRLYPIKRVSYTNILVNKRRSNTFDEINKNNLNHQIFYTNTVGNNKLFFHTRTCSVIYPKDLNSALNDSDNEPDPEWLKEQTELFIQEFADVNQGEKEIMRLWNLHILSYGNFIADSQLLHACETFIEKKGNYLISRNLANNFYLHLANLYDYDLLKPSSIAKLCDLLNFKYFENFHQ